MEGTIGRNVKARLANCEVNGTISGDVDISFDRDDSGAQAYTAGSPPPVSVPNVKPGLTFGDAPNVEGSLKYTSRWDAEISESAKIAGNVEHNRPKVSTKAAVAKVDPAWSTVSRLVTLLIVGFCVVLIAPNWTRRVTDSFKSKPLASLGFGAIGLIGVWVLLVMILVGIVALSILAGVIKLRSLIPIIIVLGVGGVVALLVGLWFLAAYLAEVVLGLFVGRWVLGLANPSLAENRFIAIGLGVLLIGSFGMVPYLGNLLGLFAFVFTLGAICLCLFRKSQPEAVPADKPLPAEAYRRWLWRTSGTTGSARRYVFQFADVIAETDFAMFGSTGKS